MIHLTYIYVLVIATILFLFYSDFYYVYSQYFRRFNTASDSGVCWSVIATSVSRVSIEVQSPPLLSMHSADVVNNLVDLQ